MGVLSRITDEGLLSRFSAEGLLLRFAELDILRQAAYEHRVAIALTGVGLYVLRKLRAYWRLRHIKGPFSTGFFGLWHTRAIVGYESHKVYKNATDRYGPLVRIGPNSLLTSDTDLWLHINSARSDYSRAAWFNLSARFQPGRDTVVSQVDEVKHKARRAQVAPGYSGKENLALEESMDIHVAELIDLIRGKYLSTDSSTKPINFPRMMSFLTIDVISRIGFGEPFGDLAADADVDNFIEWGNARFATATWTLALGLLETMHIPWVFKAVGPSEKDKDGFGKTIANARWIVESRLKQGDMSKKSDMLASFMRHGLDKEDLITEAVLQILVGADTTAGSLRGTMLYVLSHPRVYRKLQDEIDAFVRDGEVGPSIVSDAVAKRMPYLQAVLKEGIRIHPPVTNEMPKVVPKGGDMVTVAGGQEVWLPGGTHVGVAILALMRGPIFGEDVDHFRPERWLEEDEQRLAGMNRTLELVFGYGKFQCLGKAISWTEMGKAMFEMMRNFDWSVANPEQPWKEKNYAGLLFHTDMFLLASEREKFAA